MYITITVLNEHAGMRTSELYEASNKFYRLFNNFIQLFEKPSENYDEG